MRTLLRMITNQLDGIEDIQHNVEEIFEGTLVTAGYLTQKKMILAIAPGQISIFKSKVFAS